MTNKINKHKWWHFIYGKKLASEVVFKSEKIRTDNFWEECKKCGVMIGKKTGGTTIGPFEFEITKKP